MNLVNRSMIAPCGMNCALCLGYQRDKNKCLGCNNSNEGKPNSCKNCIIKNCILLEKTNSKFCYQCESFPCKRLKQLDKRYRLKYHMSMIDNLKYIKEKGIDKFLNNELKRWKCKNCGSLICVHRDICFKCNTKKIFEEVKYEK